MLVHGPGHSEIRQFDCSAGVDEAVPAGDVSVNVLELRQITQSPGDIQRHGRQTTIGHLVKLLTVSLAHQVAPGEKISAEENSQDNIFFLKNNKKRELTF